MTSETTHARMASHPAMPALKPSVLAATGANAGSWQVEAQERPLLTHDDWRVRHATETDKTTVEIVGDILFSPLKGFSGTIDAIVSGPRLK